MFWTLEINRFCENLVFSLFFLDWVCCLRVEQPSCYSIAPCSLGIAFCATLVSPNRLRGNVVRRLQGMTFWATSIPFTIYTLPLGSVNMTHCATFHVLLWDTDIISCCLLCIFNRTLSLLVLLLLLRSMHRFGLNSCHLFFCGRQGMDVSVNGVRYTVFFESCCIRLEAKHPVRSRHSTK